MISNDADREAIRVMDQERRELEWWIQGPCELQSEVLRVGARIDELRKRLGMPPLDD